MYQWLSERCIGVNVCTRRSIIASEFQQLIDTIFFLRIITIINVIPKFGCSVDGVTDANMCAGAEMVYGECTCEGECAVDAAIRIQMLKPELLLCPFRQCIREIPRQILLRHLS